MVLEKICAVLTAFFTLFGLLLFPNTGETPVFGTVQSVEKQEFDEGDFVMGAYDLIVSPDGSDENPGTEALPLRSLQGAKEKLKNQKAAVHEPVTVWFREGVYLLDEAVCFDGSDLGNVIYRSMPGAQVAFTGAVNIDNWTAGKINGREALVAAVDTDSLYFHALFKDGERLQVSTWPKEGAFQVKNVLTEDALTPESNFFKNHAAFYVQMTQLMRFANLSDVRVRIMHKWCDDVSPLHSADTTTGRIELSRATSMSIDTGDNFVYENVRETLSEPGEWYLDRAEGLLYYIPLDGETTENTVVQAPITKEFISVDGISTIQFQGISFSETDWDLYGEAWGTFDSAHPLYENLLYPTGFPQAAYSVPAAVTVQNASGIDFVDCTFKNISQTAVIFGENTRNCAVDACLFDSIGGNAVFIKGAFAIPATTGDIRVTNCHIRKYGRIFNNAIGVLLCHADNCCIENNEIHEGWYTAVSVGWVWGYTENPTNNIRVKNNLIYDIGNGWLSDMGGIYTLGMQPDTVLSGNVIYNVGCYDGAQGYGGWGIYLDEGSSGITVENNLVYDCSSQTFHQHYGRDNILRNNIFAFGGDGAFRITKHEDHNSLFLQNNIIVTDDKVMYKDTTDEGWFIDSDNLYWDYTNRRVYSGSSTKIAERLGLVAMAARGYYNNAVFKDPMFRDAANRDFTLAENSPALATGFEPWEITAGTLYTID